MSETNDLTIEQSQHNEEVFLIELPDGDTIEVGKAICTINGEWGFETLGFASCSDDCYGEEDAILKMLRKAAEIITTLSSVLPEIHTRIAEMQEHARLSEIEE